MKILIGILVGCTIGALIGWKGRCATGACPLTSNPYLGGIYGALLGAMLGTMMSCSFPGPAQKTYERGKNSMNTTNTKGIVSISDEDMFREVVHNSSLPVIVDFWAPWCGPCRTQAPVLDELAANYGQAVRIVKVNVDDHPRLVSRFSIHAIPTMILFEDGRVEKHLVGLQSLDDLKQAIDV